MAKILTNIARPILIETETRTDLYSLQNGKLNYGNFEPNHEFIFYYKLVFIDFETKFNYEPIQGEFVVKHCFGEADNIIVYINAIEDCGLYTFSKIIVKENQIPIDYIKNVFIKEFNSNNVKDIEIEMEKFLVTNNTVATKPKLYEKYVKIIEKNNLSHLYWIYYRLTNKYGEKSNYDYMIKLCEISEEYEKLKTQPKFIYTQEDVDELLSKNTALVTQLMIDKYNNK